MTVKDAIFIGETPFSGSPTGSGDVILTVEQNGDLRWFMHIGNGKEDVSGSTGWHPNSGNTIGNGFSTYQHIVGVGRDGIFLVVEENGDLRYFRYQGMGEHDPSGSSGFLPNTGNTIGNGWNGLNHITAYPFFPPEEFDFNQIFAAQKDGNLRWFGYSGNGEHDPSGSSGSHPKSQTFIGNGWNNQQFLVASGPVHFTVPRSGPDKGNLLFFRYIGKGEGNVSGSIGWAQNSGNRIGNGWGDLRYLFSGGHPGGHGGTRLFGIRQNGDLIWFNYSGRGEDNVSGNTGFLPNSGNRIGNGW
jgi:hypothetical protein